MNEDRVNEDRSEHADFTTEFLRRARDVGFLPFEAVDDKLDDHWHICGAGGSSTGGLQIEVGNRQGGSEITITTCTKDLVLDDRTEIEEAIREKLEIVLDDQPSYPFSLSLTVEERWRELLVDGIPVLFRGLAIQESEVEIWRADVGAETTVVIRLRGASLPSGLRRRASLSDTDI